MKHEFTVNDMSCNHCKARIEKELLANGVKNISIDLNSKVVSLESELSNDQLIEIIDKAGYTASIK